MQRTGESGLEFLRNHLARPPLIMTLVVISTALKNYIIILTIAAVIGVPVTFTVLHLSFWLSHGAGGLGFIVMIITVPGLFVGPTFGMAGIVVVQIVYYVLIAMGVKALVLRYVFERTENAS